MRNILFKLPDREHRFASWLIVAACVLCIYLTIPLARLIQAFFEQWLGRNAYFVAAAIAGVFISLVVSTYMFRRRKEWITLRLLWLCMLLLGAVWVIRNQLQTPAEAIHFFEYGVLSFLLFRAWSHHMQDKLIYPTAAMSLIIIAATDEFLQWLMPGRYWDFRDIRLNAMAGIFVQAMIALVISPSGIQSGFKPRSVRILCMVSWVALLLTGLAISNTPARVDIYSSRIPFMRFLLNNRESVMTEYGYRHVDPDIGVFYSRLTLDKLRQADADRGRAVGEIVLRYQSFVDYQEFIRMFSASVDPFMHEMRVHLHRRDHYLNTSWQYQGIEPAVFAYHMTTSFRENQILEKYFSNAVKAAQATWDPVTAKKVAKGFDPNIRYVSPVSDHLVTGASEAELWFIIVTTAGFVGFIYRRYGREPSRSLDFDNGGKSSMQKG